MQKSNKNIVYLIVIAIYVILSQLIFSKYGQKFTNIINPIFWIINQFRNFLIWGTYPNILTLINTILLSAIILILGIIIFKKYENKVIMKF